MEDKQILLDNISKVHTTEMGIDRIKKIGSFKGEILWDYLVKAKKNEKKNT